MFYGPHHAGSRPPQPGTSTTNAPQTPLNRVSRGFKPARLPKAHPDTRTYLVCIHPQFLQGSSHTMAKLKKSPARRVNELEEGLGRSEVVRPR